MPTMTTTSRGHEAVTAAVVQDFESLLRILNRPDGLDAEAFGQLVTAVAASSSSSMAGATRSSSDNDQSWAASIFADPATSRLTGPTLQKLYNSVAYTACTDHVGCGRDLMAYLAGLFDHADVNRDGCLSQEELQALLAALLVHRNNDNNMAMTTAPATTTTNSTTSTTTSSPTDSDDDDEKKVEEDDDGLVAKKNRADHHRKKRQSPDDVRIANELVDQLLSYQIKEGEHAVAAATTVTKQGLGLTTTMTMTESFKDDEEKKDEADVPLYHQQYHQSFLLARELAQEIFVRCGCHEKSSSAGVNLEQVAAVLLRYNVVHHHNQADAAAAAAPPTVRVHGFDERNLNPFHVSNDDFVKSVEAYVFQHPALHHHLLDSLEKGVYGDATAAVVCNLLRAYRFFTCHFCRYLKSCESKMTDEAHVHLLNENQAEEHGEYEEDDIEMMKQLGLDPELLKGVVHSDLFLKQIDSLNEVSPSPPPDAAVLESIARAMVQAFDAACLDDETSTAGTSIAAMYFGSELLVADLYSQISGFLGQDARLSKQDLSFFILHIDMDVEHARLMRLIVMAHCNTAAQRASMVAAVSRIMDARVDFFDKFVQTFFPPTGHGGVASGPLYNQQSNNWVRKQANCLSDFTGRPVVFEFCAPHVPGGFVLDVGCGEGYVGRKFIKMGAAAVTGVDISSEMVARARENAISPNETYLVGNATRLETTIAANPATIGVIPGMSTRDGFYDLAVGIFVFNYTSIFDMNRICQQVYAALKPGGHFVFSVPHPFMLNAHESNDDSFAFIKGNVGKSAYFSLRDRAFSGTIKTLDGRVLNVKMCFKTISDYMDAVKAAGFSVEVVHEARVLPEHVAEHPHFFESVKDSPLHIVFKVQKPITSAAPLARKIRYGPRYRLNVGSTIMLVLPPEIRQALDSVVGRLLGKGIVAASYEMTTEDRVDLEPVAVFAQQVRRRLEVDTGVALVQGLNTSSEQFAKLSFLLLASLVGIVDGSARGKLFDVRDTQLKSTDDNVLFSVSNSEATWHTDGASIHKSYSVASLLSLHPAAKGGELRVANAVNAFEYLEQRIPKFLLYELQRNLPRDILESGLGLGHTEDVLLAASRSPELLAHRVRSNAYPIYQQDANGGMNFRYMRYWIETGHAKAGIPLSPLLKVAMDLLDQALDENVVFERQLQPGEAVFCNNSIIAHARNEFVSDPDVNVPRRHKVRTWIQLQ